MNEAGGKLLLLALAGIGGLYLLDRSNQSGAPGGSSPGGGSGTIIDPGGGAPLSPLSQPSNFPVYGAQGGQGAGAGSSSTPVAAAAAAAGAPPAGQAATIKALQTVSGGTSPTSSALTSSSLQAAIAAANQRNATAIATANATGNYGPVSDLTRGLPLSVPPVHEIAVALQSAQASGNYAGVADLTRALPAQILTPTQVLAAQQAAAQQAAFAAALAAPHPSIANRTNYRAPAPPPPPPAYRAPIPGRAGGPQAF